MMTIAAFYQFTAFADPDALRAPLRSVAMAADVRGTVLVAPEGINGTIAGPRDGVDAVLAHIRALPGCHGLEWKEAEAAEQPFRKLKIRLKREIVTFGQPVDPAAKVGTYVAPEDWNAVVTDPGTVVIDTRNGYEVDCGTFQGAVDPKTESFGDFPKWWEDNRDQFQGKRIAMFCTGGIRCEKASSWLLDQGVPEVLHLKGGILKYLEKVPEAQTTWQGECFVFDDRVSVGHGLAQGSHVMCHACGHPVAPADQDHADYRPGISCPGCIDRYSDADRTRFAERQRQMSRARRGI